MGAFSRFIEAVTRSLPRAPRDESMLERYYAVKVVSPSLRAALPWDAVKEGVMKAAASFSSTEREAAVAALTRGVCLPVLAAGLPTLHPVHLSSL